MTDREVAPKLPALDKEWIKGNTVTIELQPQTIATTESPSRQGQEKEVMSTIKFQLHQNI